MMKWVLLGGAGWAIMAAAAVRFVSSKWHPDKGAGLDRIPEYTVEGIPKAWQDRTDEKGEQDAST